MTPTQQKTSALVALWYQLVNLGHHKDRDCHWNLETTYSYDGRLAFRVSHYGYVHREVDRECASYPEAEAALLEELVKAFEEQFESAEERAKDGENYDTDPQLILALKPEFDRIMQEPGVACADAGLAGFEAATPEQQEAVVGNCNMRLAVKMPKT